MKILCICPIGIGNYLLVYPACAQIKKQRPDVTLILLGPRAAIREMAENDPLWSGVIAFNASAALRNPLAAIAIVNQLRREKFDASLNLFPANTWHYNLLSFLAGIPQRFGFDYGYHPLTRLGFLLNHRIPAMADRHDVQQNIALAASFTGSNPTVDPLVFPAIASEDDQIWAAGAVATAARRRRIAVHPGSSVEHGMDAKRWPAKRFGQVADHCAEKFGTHVFVVGGPEEEALKREVIENMGRPATFVAPVTLGRTTALLASCDLCIANDSGIMHMAACSGVPTIGIFGPTDEKRNGPVGAPTLIVRKGQPLWTAANVGNRRTPRGVDPRESLLTLTVEEALETIEPWLENLWENDSTRHSR
jgi:lipopolysaccharide heptosyltransferase II